MLRLRLAPGTTRLLVSVTLTVGLAGCGQEPTSPPQPLPAPEQISPPDGSVFSHYPRVTTLAWRPVVGAFTYGVEIDCYHCCQEDRWCSEVGGHTTIASALMRTSYDFDFVGAQPGRWRVWAMDKPGHTGERSGWWTFTYLQ